MLVRDRGGRTMTAREVRDLAAACHARLSSGQSAVVARPRVPRRRWVVATVLACALAVGGAAWRMERNAKVRWAQHQALPEIIKLAGADQFDDAYRLAQQAQPYIADDPLLAEQLGRSPVGRLLSRIRLVRRCSIVRTAVAASLGGGSVPARSTRGYRGACCTSRPRWQAARRPKMLVPASSPVRQHSFDARRSKPGAA